MFPDGYGVIIQPKKHANATCLAFTIKACNLIKAGQYLPIGNHATPFYKNDPN